MLIMLAPSSPQMLRTQPCLSLDNANKDFFNVQIGKSCKQTKFLSSQQVFYVTKSVKSYSPAHI